MIRPALAAALLLASSAAFAAPKVGDSAPAVSTKDVKGRAIVVPDPGKPMVLAFVAKATGDKAAEINREIRVTHPEAVVITFVDVSSYPGLLHGMVNSKMKVRHEEAFRESSEAFKKAGKTPPDDLDTRIHIVADFNGKIVEKAYDAKDTDKEAHFVVVGADGKIVAVFEKTPTLAEVKSALDKLLLGVK